LHKNISIISPECAIISVGEKNSYGHPANEVLETLSKVGADIKRSDLCGSVRVMLRKGKVSTWQKLKTSK
jgi:competence protein ComEC